MDTCELDDIGIDLDLTHHRQVEAAWGTTRAFVDERLAPLLEEVWRAGLQTCSSCENLGESLSRLADERPHLRATGYAGMRAAIDFHPQHTLAFLDLVVHGSPTPGLYRRITDWAEPGAWTIHGVVLPFDGRFRLVAQQLLFPSSDIEQVAECLRRANDRRATRSPGEPSGAGRGMLSG